MNTLRDKIIDPVCPVILYELISPSSIDPARVDAYTECAIDLLTSASIKIDAVNIPEIRDEETKGSSTPSHYLSKMDSGEFAQILENALYKHTDVVLNHCTVYEPLDEQLKWVEASVQHHIHNLVLVGGSSSKIKYPGPSVLDMGHYIQHHYQPTKLFCGGITIQSRHAEPARLLAKGANGIEFFTSQIIYDAESVKALLKEYAHVCREQGVLPKRIFLSFAPISTHGDLNFLRWLGVTISSAIEKELFRADIGVGWRSAKVCAHILRDILSFMQQENINVPIGLNIEHITRHNFELSLTLIERLGALYQSYMTP